ncbi:MAG TPA: choice-of-anchor tandem repeat NxxGxxAF-containing protein [Blastocatellia bacterium]|nr:choice-of-anchor tandem repeat NxxGxxAF-containing protein [Blastocatellia bacterium]
MIAALAAVCPADRPLAQQEKKPATTDKAQKPGENEPKQKEAEKQSSGDDPVAITERSREEKKIEIPPLGPNQMGTFGFPDINNKGAVAFLGRFISPSSPQGVGRGIFVQTEKGLQTMVRDGDKASNLNEPLIDFSNPSINENGDLVFIGNYIDSKKEEGHNPQPGQQPESPAASAETHRKSGIFLRNASGLRMLAQLGQEVPRMPSHFGNLGNPTINTKGLVAFIGTYVDPDGRGLFYLDSTSNPPKLNLIVRSGQRTIIPDSAMVYSEHFYPSAINENGEVAFFVRLGDSSGIFVKREKGIELVAQQGKEAPVPEAKYIGFGNQAPTINNKGDVAFVGFFDGPNAARALFIKEAGKDGPARLVLKSGDPVGNTEAKFSSFNAPALNSRGELAFIGFYGGRTRGIFLLTEKGVEVIARAEDPVPGGGKGEVFNNFANVSLNDRGEVVFYGQLKNSTVGIFIKDAKGLRPLAKRGDKVPDTRVAER